jgi:hypothetical protein
MENFDIAKYLKEHNLGSYGMFNGYVDIKPLKEEETEVELNTEVPYKGPEPKLAGDGTEFKQAETVSEEMEGDPDYSRIMELGGEQIEQGIISLMDDGLENIDILELCKEFIKAHMEARRAGHRF